MGYRITVSATDPEPYVTLKGEQRYARIQLDVTFSDSPIGCFSRALSFVTAPQFIGWTDSPTKATPIPAENPFLGKEVNPEYARQQQWRLDRYDQLRENSPHVEPLLLRLYKTLVDKLGSVSNMFLIGDTLAKKHGIYAYRYGGTRGFVQYLIDHKMGSVVELPAILNANYKYSPHLCQSWVWITPPGVRGATVPATVIHNEEAMTPIEDAIEEKILKDYDTPRKFIPSQMSAPHMERLVLSKKGMKVKK